MADGELGVGPSGHHASDEAGRGRDGSGGVGTSKSTSSTPVVRTLLLINVGVFVLWSLPILPREVLGDNLLISWSLLVEGRLWVLVTAVFSHNLLLHLLVNMIVLLSFGPPMERVMGSGRFLRFYLVAGLVSSIAHAVTSNLLLGQPDLRALGASGALAGVLILFSFSFPKAKVLLFFIVPVPAILAALAFIAIDVWGLIAQMGGGTLPIGHGAHLGGGVAGIVYYLMARDELRSGRDRLRGLRRG